jgi:histidine ammonia-lyase
VREQIAFYDEDRYFAPDIAAAKAMIVAGVIAATASDKIAL